MANDDNQVKRQAAITFAKALKLERNQVLAKESGVLNLLATQIASNDISIVISAAILIEGLSKNGSINYKQTNKIRIEFIRFSKIRSGRFTSQTYSK